MSEWDPSEPYDSTPSNDGPAYSASSDNVPAGWYPTGDGNQRYWDGAAWTDQVAPMVAATPMAVAGSAQGVMPSSDERTMAVLAHILPLVAGFLGPLIIYLMKKDESPYVRDQAGEALNFAISVTIYSIAYFIISFILIFVIIGVVFFIIAPFLAIGILVLQVLAAVAANKGEYYRYPATIRFIK